MENLHHHRKSYEKDQLDEYSVDPNPIVQFRSWFLEAQENPQISEANAMSIATVEPDGCPRVRTVLLKSYSAEGFVFFTNYDSKKGNSIENHHFVGIQFFWPVLERQIIIKAKVSRVPENISDGYFSVRPRGSQFGALVSPQSSIIEGRAFLEERLQMLEKEYEGKEIARPKNWGGYLAEPYEIEFWQGRPNRLHDRIIYNLEEDYNWKISRLAP